MAFHAWRTARKQYKCQSRVSPLCDGAIEVGDRHVRSTMHPKDEWGNGEWHSIRVCSECCWHFRLADPKK